MSTSARSLATGVVVLLLATAGVTGFLLAGAGHAGVAAGSTDRADAASTRAAGAGGAAAVQEACDYEQLYDETIDSVVLIETGEGLGSGFVFRTDGATSYAITNEHVVGDAETVQVRFSRGESVISRVVGASNLTDLAVVRINETPDYAAALNVSAGPIEPGQRVAALGSPFGLTGTITEGIISGVNRSIPIQGGFPIPGTVQTDAPINPGNSGGPLVTCEGTVVGVNRAGGAENIGFAVSARVVQRVVPALIENGTFAYPFLGVEITQVDAAVAAAMDLNVTRGVMVVDVASGVPAADVLQGATDSRIVAGQRVPVGGDVILAIDGTPVEQSDDLLRYLLTETRPGEEVRLTILRDGERRTVNVTVVERPETNV